MLLVDSNLSPYSSSLVVSEAVRQQFKSKRYDSPKYIDLLVDVLDTLTGQEWLQCAYSWPRWYDNWDVFLDYFVFEWGENNWSCDHHRGPLTGAPCPRPLPDSFKGEHSDWEEGEWLCGHDLKVRVWHNGEVIFSDYPDGAK